MLGELDDAALEAFAAPHPAGLAAAVRRAAPPRRRAGARARGRRARSARSTGEYLLFSAGIVMAPEMARARRAPRWRALKAALAPYDDRLGYLNFVGEPTDPADFYADGRLRRACARSAPRSTPTADGRQPPDPGGLSCSTTSSGASTSPGRRRACSPARGAAAAARRCAARRGRRRSAGRSARRAPLEAGLGDRLGRLLGRAEHPARRALLRQLALREALGRDEARHDGADVDAVGVLLGAQRVAPDGERGLGGRVGAGAGAPDPAGGARDVDDRARRGRAQQRQQRLGQPHLGVEVQRHRAADRGVAGLGERAAPAGARVVDEQVQPAAVVLLQVRAGARGRVVGEQVERQRRRPAPAAPPRAARAGRRGARAARAASPGSRASRRAVASPRPLDAPVIRATRRSWRRMLRGRAPRLRAMWRRIIGPGRSRALVLYGVAPAVLERARRVAGGHRHRAVLVRGDDRRAGR